MLSNKFATHISLKILIRKLFRFFSEYIRRTKLKRMECIGLSYYFQPFTKACTQQSQPSNLYLRVHPTVHQSMYTTKSDVKPVPTCTSNHSPKHLLNKVRRQPCTYVYFDRWTMETGCWSGYLPAEFISRR